MKLESRLRSVERSLQEVQAATKSKPLNLGWQISPQYERWKELAQQRREDYMKAHALESCIRPVLEEVMLHLFSSEEIERLGVPERDIDLVVFQSREFARMGQGWWTHPDFRDSDARCSLECRPWNKGVSYRWRNQSQTAEVETSEESNSPIKQPQLREDSLWAR